MKHGKINCNDLTASGLIYPTADGSNGQIIKTDGAGNLSFTNNVAGKIVQVVNYQTGAVATGTTTIPIDDTIPQNIEGDEYMTLAITPASTTNKLKIEVKYVAYHTSASATMICTLFQDSTAGALKATVTDRANSTTAEVMSGTLTHYMTTGTTSATTFKVRLGSDIAGTTTFNGLSGGRLFGGVIDSSITITEISV